MPSDKRQDWEKLAEKESRGKDLSRETVEGIRLDTVYGPDDSGGIDSGYPGMPPYTRGPEVRSMIEAMWMPRLEEFRPEMLFVSAGFDAHRDDDLGQLGLVEADYEWITRRIKEVADRHASGRIVSCLEGGYSLGALARSVAAHLRVLAEIG